MSLVIDCHGHYTTAPKALENWRNAQIAGIKDPSVMPKAADLKISDDELRESIETNQLKLMKERGSDITLFSPRASFMAHHVGDFAVSASWAAVCNELCYRVSELFPDQFVPAAMLPQSPGVAPETCIPELVKCVEQYGAVALNLNPDPSGGHWTTRSPSNGCAACTGGPCRWARRGSSPTTSWPRSGTRPSAWATTTCGPDRRAGHRGARASGP